MATCAQSPRLASPAAPRATARGADHHGETPAPQRHLGVGSAISGACDECREVQRRSRLHADSHIARCTRTCDPPSQAIRPPSTCQKRPSGNGQGPLIPPHLFFAAVSSSATRPRHASPRAQRAARAPGRAALRARAAAAAAQRAARGRLGPARARSAPRPAAAAALGGRPAAAAARRVGRGRAPARAPREAPRAAARRRARGARRAVASRVARARGSVASHRERRVVRLERRLVRQGRRARAAPPPRLARGQRARAIRARAGPFSLRRVLPLARCFLPRARALTPAPRVSSSPPASLSPRSAGTSAGTRACSRASARSGARPSCSSSCARSASLRSPNRTAS